MFIEPVLISLIIAKIRKGNFKNMEKLEISGWYLLLISGGIQLLLSVIKKVNFSWSNIILNDYFTYIHGLSYILIIICILMNIKKTSMKLFLMGVILNFLVIIANGGKMPVSINGISGINSVELELPHREFDIKHIAVTSDTKLVYLADIILIPRPYPLPKILSVGDVFIMLGLFVFLQEVMVLDDSDKLSQFL